MNRNAGIWMLLLATSQAWASDMNVSGRYEDVKGSQIVFSQVGQSLSVSPDMNRMPEQARQVLGQIKLTGTIKTPEDPSFSLNASYKTAVEPTEGMKLKMNVDFSAKGEKVNDGLVMKDCEWKATMVVFSQGEIAGSETLSEKCVGLWKRKP